MSARGRLLFFALVASSASAGAQPTGVAPSVSGSLVVEIQNDRAYDSEDPANERNDLYTTTEPELVLTLAPGVSVTAHGVLEPVRDPGPGEDRVFDDHGLYLEELRLDVERGPGWLRAGKFAVDFGRAWDIAPGVYGTDLAEDYELTERVGVAGGLVLGSDTAGEHRIGVGVYRLDTSVLSDSALRSRGRLRTADGGVGNTDSLESFSLGASGTLPAGPGIRYHVAWVRQAAGTGTAEDEDGLVFSVDTDLPLSDYTLTPLLEHARFDDADGVRGRTRRYWTAGLAVTRGGWNAAASSTWRDTETPGTAGTEDVQVQVSAGYAWTLSERSGLSLDVGWKHLEEGGVETRTLGALAVYTIAF